jgi:ComF family protein
MNFNQSISRHLGLFLDLIFPPRCVNCLKYSRESEALCSACFTLIKINANLQCIVCRARIPEGRKICHFGAPCILGTAAKYEGPAKALVQALKFQGVREAAVPLAQMLRNFITLSGVPLDSFILVPVPLGRGRRRTRGYNQAELIAAHLGKLTGLKVAPDILIRTRETKQQSALSGAARRENVTGCFNAGKGAAGARIFLIDDVCTSGSTLFAAAEALRARGARKIIALAATGA